MYQETLYPTGIEQEIKSTRRMIDLLGEIICEFIDRMDNQNVNKT